MRGLEAGKRVADGGERSQHAPAPGLFLPLAPASAAPRLLPKFGLGGETGGRWGRSRRLAFPCRVPHRLPWSLPRLGLLTSRPGRRAREGGGRGEEALRRRQGGGRARSPGPELQNSPAASPRAQPVNLSVRPPAPPTAPGELGACPGDARRARSGVGAPAACARDATVLFGDPGRPWDCGGQGRAEAPSMLQTPVSAPSLWGAARLSCGRHARASGIPLRRPRSASFAFCAQAGGKSLGRSQGDSPRPASRRPGALGVPGRELPVTYGTQSPRCQVLADLSWQSGCAQVRARVVAGCAPHSTRPASPVRPPAVRSNFLGSAAVARLCVGCC